ncbi:13364_t:CDS:2, partial [Racocetra persica]
MPHGTCFELPSSWYLCQFRSIFLVNVKSCLHTYRSAQGSKQFIIHYPENLFYYVFHQEPGFKYQVTQQNEKTTKTESKVRVMTEKKDLETQQMLETEL